MDFHEIKMKFNSVLNADELIDSKLAEIVELKRRLTDVKSPSFGDRVQGTRDPDKFTDTISNIIELEKEVNEDIDRLVDNKRECRELIERLDSNLYKAVLYKIYFEAKPLKKVAYECKRGVRQIMKIRNKAIVQIAEISKSP